MGTRKYPSPTLVYRCTLYRCTDEQVYRYTGVQVYGCTGVRVYRCTGEQVNRCTSVQVRCLPGEGVLGDCPPVVGGEQQPGGGHSRVQ